MSPKQLLKEFLEKYTINDILSPIEGELHEYATNNATYFYGNGELIVSPPDNSQDETVYVIDSYDDKKVISLY